MRFSTWVFHDEISSHEKLTLRMKNSVSAAVWATFSTHFLARVSTACQILSHRTSSPRRTRRWRKSCWSNFFTWKTHRRSCSAILSMLHAISSHGNLITEFDMWKSHYMQTWVWHMALLQVCCRWTRFLASLNCEISCATNPYINRDLFQKKIAINGAY